MIEIAVRQAAAAGARNIVVVTGHEAAQVEEALRSIVLPAQCTVIPQRLNDWSKPNGWSVIAGAKLVSGPFLLMMADHIFSDSILPLLAEQNLCDADVILATDRAENPLVDPDDATWVALDEEGRIRQIGKEIENFDCVDCGAFLAGHQLPRAIEQAIACGKPGSLSDGMQVLADAGRAGTVDIADAWWIDVDDPRAHDLAEEQVADHLALFSHGQRQEIKTQANA